MTSQPIFSLSQTQRHLVIPLNRIVFPATSIPISVSETNVIEAAESAFESKSKILLVFSAHVGDDVDVSDQRETQSEISPPVGTLCSILRMTHRDDDSLELLIQGHTRATASAYQRCGGVVTALAMADSSGD